MVSSLLGALDGAASGFFRVGSREPLPWSTAARRVCSVAAGLTARFPAGARVAVPMEEPLEDALILLLAALRAGLWALPLAPALPPASRAATLTRSGATLLTPSAEGPDGSMEDARPNGRLLLSTSGSTGTPLVAVLSLDALWANAQAIAESLGLTPQDTTLCVPPLAYAYGLSVVTSSLCTGASVVVEPRSAFPATLLQTAQDTGATVLAAVPTTWQLLLRGDLLAQHRPARLRMGTVAGGALPLPVVQPLRSALGPAQLRVMYGQTEACARLTCTAPADMDTHPGTVGRALFNVQLRLADDGEVLARGPNLMDGYLDDPARTAEVLRDGWLHTGDLGTLDARGNLTLTGRRRHMIKVGGTRVAPGAVESAVLGVPGVEACAVVGAPDALLGEVPWAFVAGTTPPDEILSTITPLLSAFERPRRVIVLGELPRLPGGKVDVVALRERAAGG